MPHNEFIDLLPHSTSRVTLRRFRIGDLNDFQAYRNDAEVGLYQGWTPTSDLDASAFLGEMASATLFDAGHWSQIAIAEREGDRLIGDIGVRLAEEADEAEIGFSLRTRSQGLGLASEAVSAAISLIFENTTAARVTGICDERNLASIRLLERMGMACVARVETEFRGSPCVELSYGLAR